MSQAQIDKSGVPFPRRYITCMRTIPTKPSLDYINILNSLWGICHFARTGRLDPDGMLRRDNLITSADQGKLNEWIDSISSRIAMRLDGNTP